MNFKKITKHVGVIIIGLFVGCHGSNSSATDVALAWEPPTNNVDGSALTDLTGYKLYYGTTPTVYSAVLDAGNTNTFNLTGLLQGSTYYFAVTCERHFGMTLLQPI